VAAREWGARGNGGEEAWRVGAVMAGYTRKDFMTVHVPLSNTDLMAKIDYRDAVAVFSCGWTLDKRKNTSYALSSVRFGKRTRTIHLHRFIMNAAKGDLVDHINGDGLDCRRANLRFSNKSLNSLNRPSGGKYIGVRKSATGWYASFSRHGKSIHLGTFSTAGEAAMARDRKAIEVYGEHARLNFPAAK
jgi:hypothetical protein